MAYYQYNAQRYKMSMKKMTFFDKNAKKVAGDKKKATFFTITKHCSLRAKCYRSAI